MKRVILLLAIGCLCCACASTRKTSRSSAQERVEEQAESERQISTQEQAEEQRDVVTISKTTTNKQEDTSTEEIKEDSTPKNLRWLGIIAICATVIMGCFFVLRFVGRK